MLVDVTLHKEGKCSSFYKALLCMGPTDCWMQCMMPLQSSRDLRWLTLLHLFRVLPTSMEWHRSLYSALVVCLRHQWNTKLLGSETTLTNLECKCACNIYDNCKSQNPSDAYESVSEIQEQAAHNHNSSFMIYTHGNTGLILCNMRGQPWTPTDNGYTLHGRV